MTILKLYKIDKIDIIWLEKSKKNIVNLVNSFFLSSKKKNFEEKYLYYIYFFFNENFLIISLNFETKSKIKH